MENYAVLKIRWGIFKITLTRNGLKEALYRVNWLTADEISLLLSIVDAAYKRYQRGGGA